MNGPLNTIYHNTYLGKMLIPLVYFVKSRVIPAKYIVAHKYKKVFGSKPNLNPPETLNEKIIWLKLNDKSPMQTQCADKVAVRDYIRNSIGEEYLVPLFKQTEDISEIRPENLPNAPFIIKTNHDSGGGYFVYDKSEVDWEDIRKKLKKRLNENYYWRSKEWQYKNIVPKVVVEKLLLDNEGNIPSDYKIHCFNQKVQMIQVDVGRGTSNHFRNWYNSNWQREPYRWSISLGNGKFTDPSEEDVQKPELLDEMIELSEILSKPFDYVRVDWYVLNGRLLFGELTFHHDGGYRPILPKKWDKILGDRLVLTKTV